MSECRFFPLCDMSDERCEASAQCAHYEPMPEVVRCRDCEHGFELNGYGKENESYRGMFDCMHFSQWDYYDDVPGVWPVEPDGFCAWGVRSES